LSWLGDDDYDLYVRIPTGTILFHGNMLDNTTNTSGIHFTDWDSDSAILHVESTSFLSSAPLGVYEIWVTEHLIKGSLDRWNLTVWLDTTQVVFYQGEGASSRFIYNFTQRLTQPTVPPFPGPSTPTTPLGPIGVPSISVPSMVSTSAVPTVTMVPAVQTATPTAAPTVSPGPTAPTVSPRPTFPPTPSRTYPPSVCFCGTSKVFVEGQGPTLMRNLRVGDSVLVGSGTFETVYSFGHYQPYATGKFLQLLTNSSDIALELSKEHMVFVNGRSIPASTVKVGDKIEIGSTGAPIRVARIRVVTREGIFAPFTPSGRIVVNDVVASTFVSFQGRERLAIGGFVTPLSYQWLARTFESPHRVVCHFFMDRVCRMEGYTAEGISHWVKRPLEVSHWILDQHPLVVVVMMVPLVLSFALCLSVESIVTTKCGAVASMVVVVVVLCMIGLRAYSFQVVSHQKKKTH